MDARFVSPTPARVSVCFSVPVECQRRQNYIEHSLRDPFGAIYNAPYQQQDNPNAHEHTTKGGDAHDGGKHAHSDEGGAHGGKRGRDDDEPEPPEPQPQPDFFYHVLPFIRFWIICDILAVTLMVLLLLKFTFLSRCRLRVILKRFFLIQGLLFLLRAMSIYLTSQQLPLTTCVSTIKNGSAAYEVRRRAGEEWRSREQRRPPIVAHQLTRLVAVLNV